MNKFQVNDRVRYIKKPEKVYNVIRHYPSGETFKYDITSLDGETLIIANPEAVLEKVGHEQQTPSTGN